MTGPAVVLASRRSARRTLLRWHAAGLLDVAPFVELLLALLDCPVPLMYHGWRECPHCRNTGASLWRYASRVANHRQQQQGRGAKLRERIGGAP